MLLVFFKVIGFAQETNLVETRIIKLDEALQLGIQNNRQLKIANADVAIAKENVSQFKIAKTPRLGVNTGYNYIGDPKIYSGFFSRQFSN